MSYSRLIKTILKVIAVFMLSLAVFWLLALHSSVLLENNRMLRYLVVKSLEKCA